MAACPTSRDRDGISSSVSSATQAVTTLSPFPVTEGLSQVLVSRHTGHPAQTFCSQQRNLLHSNEQINILLILSLGGG